MTRPKVTRGLPGVLDRLVPGEAGRPAFVEGLLIGAMVGAAIAGSTLWARLREGRPTPRRDKGASG